MRPLPVDYFMRATLQQERPRFGGERQVGPGTIGGLDGPTRRGVWLEASEIERSARPWGEDEGPEKIW